MVNIKVLGSGCPNCKRLAYLAERAALALKQEVKIEKVTDPVAIMQYRLMSTPGLVINEQVVSFGRVPNESEIKGWLIAANEASPTA
jgi:small redox-active disulfide protein 2